MKMYGSSCKIKKVKFLLAVVLKLGYFRQKIRNTCNVLKCDAGEDGEDQLERSCEK
jgi:hypothetical protein